MTSLSQSISNLKSYLPFTSTDSNSYRSNRSRKLYETLDPEVGFRLKLIPGDQSKASTSNDKTYNGPELIVHIIGARHLPSIFGLKRVEGYAMKYEDDYHIGQKNRLTTFKLVLRNQFIFQYGFRHIKSGDQRVDEDPYVMIQAFKHHHGRLLTKALNFQWSQSSFKSKSKVSETAAQSLPEKLFKGHFVVLTIFALLEIPAGARSSIRLRLDKFRRKSANLLQESGKTDKNKSTEVVENDIMKLTTSETRRNIGSVTYFLDPKNFDENRKSCFFETDEFWLPIKDISISSSTASTSLTSVNSSPKGQVEVILQMCETDLNEEDDSHETQNALNANKKDEQKRRLSFNDMRNRLKNLNISKKEKYKGMYKGIKEEFENIGGQIYVKTTVFEHDILSSAWKSNEFAPSLSTRWNVDNSTIIIPIVNESSLDHISLKVSVATKTKVGKKIFLGTLYINHKTKDNHWQNMIHDKGNSVPMWHSFE